jgi:hypothetical protein
MLGFFSLSWGFLVALRGYSMPTCERNGNDYEISPRVFSRFFHFFNFGHVEQVEYLCKLPGNACLCVVEASQP